MTRQRWCAVQAENRIAVEAKRRLEDALYKLDTARRMLRVIDSSVGTLTKLAGAQRLTTEALAELDA